MPAVRAAASAAALTFTSINLDFPCSLQSISWITNQLGWLTLWNYFSLLLSEKPRHWRWDFGFMTDTAIIYSSDTPDLWRITIHTQLTTLQKKTSISQSILQHSHWQSRQHQQCLLEPLSQSLNGAQYHGTCYTELSIKPETCASIFSPSSYSKLLPGS